MNLKILREYRTQKAIAKLSNNYSAFNKFWAALPLEIRFEIRMIDSWSKNE